MSGRKLWSSLREANIDADPETKAKAPSKRTRLKKRGLPSIDEDSAGNFAADLSGSNNAGGVSDDAPSCGTLVGNIGGVQSSDDSVVHASANNFASDQSSQGPSSTRTGAPPDPVPPLPKSPPAKKPIDDGKGKERLQYGSVDGVSTTEVNESVKPGSVAECSANNGSAGVSTAGVRASENPANLVQVSAPIGGDHGEQTGNPVQVSAPVGSHHGKQIGNPMQVSALVGSHHGKHIGNPMQVSALVGSHHGKQIGNPVQVSAPVGSRHGKQIGNPVQVSAPVGSRHGKQFGGSSNIAGAVFQANVPTNVAGQGSVAAPHAVRPSQHNPKDSSSSGAPPLANTNNFAFGVGAGSSAAKQPTGSNQQRFIVAKKQEVPKMVPQQPARGVDVHGDPMEIDSPTIPTPVPIHAPPRFCQRISDPMDIDIIPPTATPVGSQKRKAERDETSGGISLGVVQRPKKRVKRNPAPSQIPLSQRVWHAIKVTTGFQAGDDPYKNFVHATLSQHWRYSCARAWQVMKSLRQEAISSNRVHLFDEVVAEAEYSRYHGIMDVEHGYCPLF
ncbi:hypothetical protein BSKO_08186 [Bryopsis sp. KO-2023]|nr:hypothetical protein BSKO_08186 [Bryopsis sp. KO-2023]